MKLLSPQALLNRLDPMLPLLTEGATNLPLRHQTLHNAIAWSYDLLTEREKRLFRIISVFVGGFSLEGAAVVYDETGASEQRNIQPETPNALLDELTALIDKSLLRHTEQDDGEPRFAMLETIREFASEQLAQSEEAGAVAARHARYFMELAERAEPELLGPAQSAWLDTLAREHDNIRSTLLWTQKAGDAETGLRLSAALFRFWFVRGYWSEGRKWLVEALEHGAEVDAPIRAKSLIRLGNLAGSQSDYDAARKYHTQALAISEELGDKAAVAVALSNLGNTARLQGDYARSIAFFEQSLEINKELGQRWHVAMTLRNLSVIAREQGRYEVARRNSEEALLMQSDLGDKQSIAISLSDLGTITASEGDLKAARTYWEQSLSIWQEIGDKAGEAGSLQALGEALAVEGDYQAARALQAKSLRARYEMGTRRGIVDSLQGLAVVEQERAEPLRLARLLAAAEALRAAIGSTITPQDRARYEPWLQKARARLGPQAFTAAWEEGKRLTTEQAVALALEESPGDTQPDPSLAASTLSAAGSVSRPRHDLTHREIEVLRLIAAGLTNHDIAAHIHVSINTLQTHIRSIYSKINVTTRTAAVRYAFEHDLS